MHQHPFRTRDNYLRFSFFSSVRSIASFRFFFFACRDIQRSSFGSYDLVLCRCFEGCFEGYIHNALAQLLSLSPTEEEAEDFASPASSLKGKSSLKGVHFYIYYDRVESTLNFFCNRFWKYLKNVGLFKSVAPFRPSSSCPTGRKAAMQIFFRKYTMFYNFYHLYKIQ